MAEQEPKITQEELNEIFKARILQLETQLASFTQRPRRSIEDPEDKLDEQSDYPTWLPLVKAILDVDQKAIGCEKAQFFWLYRQLGKKMRAVVLPQLFTANETGVWDTETILKALERILGDPSKQGNSTGKLYSISIGKMSVAEYLSEFERLLHEAKATTLQDKDKIAILRNGVKGHKIGANLNTQLAVPTTYETFVNALHILGGSGTNIQAQQAHQSYGTGGGDPMDLSQVQFVRKDKKRGRSRSRSHSPPGRPYYPESSHSPRSYYPDRITQLQVDELDMQLNDQLNNQLNNRRMGALEPARLPAPPSTNAQRKAWQKAGRCRRCGGTHFINACSYDEPEQRTATPSEQRAATPEDSREPYKGYFREQEREQEILQQRRLAWERAPKELRRG